MDLRIERTRRSIINAFIELRSRKPLEKITIKELSELAFINKATFYSHYHDIYDLSEQLENEIIDMILSNIPCPEELITRPKQTTETLAISALSQKRIIDILFSESRASVLATKLEKRIKNKIYGIYPQYKNDLKQDIILSCLIQGLFHAFLSHSETADTQELIDIISTISQQMLDKN